MTAINHPMTETDNYNRLFLEDVRSIWTPEERIQLGQAPDEWLLSYYEGTDVRKFGPSIVRVQKLLSEMNFSEQETVPFLMLRRELKRHYQGGSFSKLKLAEDRVRIIRKSIMERGYEVIDNGTIFTWKFLDQNNLYLVNSVLLQRFMVAAQASPYTLDGDNLMKFFRVCGFSI